MPERLYHRPCAVCASDLEIALDTTTEDIIVRPASLPPLAKDKLDVVAHYKRTKSLGMAWTKAHGSRAIIYAASLLEALGTAGGAVEKALALMDWIQGTGEKWDLAEAPKFIGRWETAKKAAQKSVIRCLLCTAEELPGIGVCRDHFFCWMCREGLEESSGEIMRYRGQVFCRACSEQYVRK